jgi:hypothetical protein
MGECDERERAAWDGRAAVARQSGRAVSGREGRSWRRPAVGGRRGGCPYGSHMRATVEKGNVAVFLCFFLEKPRRTEGEAEEADARVPTLS